MTSTCFSSRIEKLKLCENLVLLERGKTIAGIITEYGCLPLASKSISVQEIINLGKWKNENEGSNDHPFLSQFLFAHFHQLPS